MILQFGPEAPLVLHILAAAALILHIGGGTMGMLSGATAMFARKGGRLHRVAGTVFFIAMLTMTGVAAIVAPMLPEARWTNTTAAVFTLYLVATAWGTVRRPAGRVGRFERAAVVVPLGIAAMGVALAGYGARSGVADSFATVYAFAVISALAAAADLRMIRRGGIAGADRIARHLWRMSAGLFVATGSFFFGQADVLPAAVRASFIPTVLGLAPLVLMVFWLVRVKFPRAAKLTPAASMNPQIGG
jgi:uncharacterized membrane protein